jgi:hypothetical protein
VFVEEQRRQLNERVQQLVAVFAARQVTDPNGNPLVLTTFQGTQGESNYTQGMPHTKCENCPLRLFLAFSWICASRACTNDFHTASFDRSNPFSAVFCVC